jgi:hypothetical protein
MAVASRPKRVLETVPTTTRNATVAEVELTSGLLRTFAEDSEVMTSSLRAEALSLADRMRPGTPLSQTGRDDLMAAAVRFIARNI